MSKYLFSRLKLGSDFLREHHALFIPQKKVGVKLNETVDSLRQSRVKSLCLKGNDFTVLISINK